MHLQSEKVTSTCSQRFAELDPHCLGTLNPCLQEGLTRHVRRRRHSGAALATPYYSRMYSITLAQLVLPSYFL